MTAFDKAHDTVPPRMGHALAARTLAELAGSFLICFAIYAMSSLSTSVYNPNLAFLVLGTALAYGAATYLLGPISGGQFNPAITLASMLVSRTRVADGLLYIVAQLLGALAAGGAIRYLLPTADVIGLSVWLTPAVNGFESGSVSANYLTNASLSFGIMMAIALEVVASAIVVGTAIRSEEPAGQAAPSRALAMGVAYGVGAMITYPVTGASLNPARATGIAVFAQGQGLGVEPLSQLWVFWVCPVLAAAVVALVIIVAQMAASMAAAKRRAAASAMPVPADAPDAGHDGTFVMPSLADGDLTAAPANAEDGSQEREQADAEVRQQQAGPQADADEGVERH